jgi:antitoxin CptB
VTNSRGDPNSRAEAARISARGRFVMELLLDRDTRLRRLGFRAWHRGVREADLMVGGFFDSRHQAWGEEEMDWFEALLEEQDVDIMAWALGTAEPPERFQGSEMGRLQKLDYIKHPG